MSYEAYRAKVVTGLFERGLTEQANLFLSIMDSAAIDFEFSIRETSIIPFGNFPEAAKMYLASKAVENISPNTLSQYKQNLELFFKKVNKPVYSISANDIRAYLYGYQQERHVKSSSLNLIRSNLKTFFAWLQDEGIIQKNPASRLSVIKGEPTQRHAMEPLELELLRSVCKTLREKALIDFLYSTGCRVSEAANMKIDQVDWLNHTAFVDHGKGGKSRTVYLNAESQVSLDTYVKSRDDSSPYLFVKVRKPHTQITTQAMQNEVRRIESRANIKTHVTPHVFRHTTATTAIRNGMPIEQVQRMLGHSNISTTTIYTAINQNDVKASHAKYVG